MSRVLQKIFNTVITTTLVFGTALALESEYKNSLEKVELVKTSDSTYSVNIYTQKQYQEPVKVIKKSDLSYYILLPETKNLSQSASYNSSDIRNVYTKTYPYAAQDVENGYTKINISTNKPINFTINTQTRTSVASKTQKKNLETQIPKKDSSKDFSKEKIAQTQQSRPSVTLQPKKIETRKETSSDIPKIQTNKPKITQVSIEPMPVPTKTVSKQQTETKKEVSKAKTETKKIEPRVEIKKPKVEEPKKVIIEEPKQELQQEVPEITVEEKILQDQKRIAQELEKEQETIEQNDTSIVEIEDSFDFIRAVKTMLHNRFFNSILLILAFSILFASFVVLRKPKKRTRLKNKSELMEKLENESLIPKETLDTEQERNKSFIIKNEEDEENKEENNDFSTYVIDNEQNIVVGSGSYYEETRIEKTHNEQDYEIIQKILKEDVSIEISPKEETTTEPEQNQVQENEFVEQEQPEEKSEEIQEEDKQEIEEKPVVVDDDIDSSEPRVLTKVEIAPERGFMCIKYDNNVSLMGYMFDDVYVLHNFKRPKLNDYTIKFRVADKDDNGANYIVKVDDVKLIARVTSTDMKLEVLM